MIMLTPVHVGELHSLSRYPPIGLHDAADTDLEAAGLLVSLVRPSRTASSRWRLTDRGKVVLRQTAMFCAVSHCPCHGGAPTSDEVQRIVDEQLRAALAGEHRQT